jgi:hypothetical protein
MNFLVEPFDHVMDAIKINGTMKTKLWKAQQNFGSRYKTLEVIQHGSARLRSVSQSLGDLVIPISIQECHGNSVQLLRTSGSGFLPVFISICLSAFFFSF